MMSKNPVTIRLIHFLSFAFILSPFGSEALYLAATALLNPGDEMIIPTPCFVSYQAETVLAGGVTVEVPCRFEDNFEVDPKAIEEIRKYLNLVSEQWDHALSRLKAFVER